MMDSNRRLRGAVHVIAHLRTSMSRIHFDSAPQPENCHAERVLQPILFDCQRQ